MARGGRTVQESSPQQNAPVIAHRHKRLVSGAMRESVWK